MDSHTQTC